MAVFAPSPVSSAPAGDDPAAPIRALEAENTSLRAILDNLPSMIGYWDRDLRNRFGNKAYRAWFGIDAERMAGMHIRDVIGEERYRLNLPYIEGVLRGEPQLFERAIPTPDGGSLRHSLAHYIPDIADGEVRGFYVLVTDVTAVKEVEAALRASEERYRAVVEDQTEVICRLRQDGTFLFANEVYCRFFGRQAEDILGKRWQPAAHSDDLPRIEAQLGRLTPASPVVLIENRVYSGSGEVRWMQFVNRGFFDADGRLAEIQCVGRDITERKAAERALEDIRAGLERLVAERTEQLRQLAVQATLAEERERQAIARDLHDDLGQRLHVARLKLDALAKAGAGAPPQLAELAQIIGDASSLVRSLTSQLSPPVLSDLGLVPALHWLCDEMERNYGLVVEPVTAPLPAPLAHARAAILFRAARELLINVARHARTDTARLHLTPLDNGLLLTVEDGGVGIVGAGQASADGGGFGLASVRERILFFGGRMELQSPPAGGLRVVLWMPYGNPDEREGERKP